MQNNNRKTIERGPVPELIRFSKTGFPEFIVFEAQTNDLTFTEIILFEDPAKFASITVYN